MSKATRSSTGFVGVIANPQSYLNIVYLLLAFPLGTFYFVFLVTGLSLGLGGSGDTYPNSKESEPLSISWLLAPACAS